MIKKIKENFIFYILVLITITVFFAIFYAVLVSFSVTDKVPRSLSEFTIENYTEVIEQYNFLKMNINSLIITLTTVVSSVIIASMCAFALSKIDFFVNKYVIGIFFLGLFMPGQVLIVPIYQMIANLNLIDTRIGLILYYVASAMPFAIFLILANIKSMPKPLIESAFIDGASWFTIYKRIALPFLKPTLFTLAILNFLTYWNELFYGMMVLQDPNKRTVTVEMATLSAKYVNNESVLFAGLILGALPIVIFYLIFHKKIVKGGSEGAIK